MTRPMWRRERRKHSPPTWAISVSLRMLLRFVFSKEMVFITRQEVVHQHGFINATITHGLLDVAPNKRAAPTKKEKNLTFGEFGETNF